MFVTMSSNVALRYSCGVRSPEPEPIANVIGRNFRRIREATGLTQDEAARYVRRAGPLWTTSRVGDFERGRSDVTVGLLAAVSLALTVAIREANARGAGLSVTARPADFLHCAGQTQLTKMGPDPIGAVLTDVFAGADWPHTDAELLGADDAALRALSALARDPASIDADDPDNPSMSHPIEDIREKAGLAEHRVAQRLGIEKDRLAELSWDLFGQTFTEARNELAGTDASPQKRGRVARELEAKLRKALGHGDD